MKCSLKYNRRWIGLLLAMALVVLTLPSHASWQCLDGTRCPLNCPMLRAVPSDHNTCMLKMSVHCSMCTAHIAALSQKNRTVHCTSLPCVLRVAEQPASSLKNGVEIYVPLLAMPPPALFTPPFVRISTDVVFSPLLPFYPQRFLRPNFGRAPPICL